MRFGIVGSSGTVDQVLELAREAEAHGWDGFFTWDGISLGPMDTWDPWTLLGAVAGVTERIRLGALVFPLARRRPWKVAREALTVDHLSHGRLVVPVGLGVLDDRGFSGVRDEATSLRERAELLDEALEILDLAWSGETFSYDGKHHVVADMVIRPRPVQRPRIPLWVVGGWPSERSMSRAARWDGVVVQPLRSMAPTSVDDVAGAAAWVAERRSAPGPDQRPGPFDVVAQGELPDDPEEATEHAPAQAAAGAPWGGESRGAGAKASPEALLDHIRQGPPVL